MSDRERDVFHALILIGVLNTLLVGFFFVFLLLTWA